MRSSSLGLIAASVALAAAGPAGAEELRGRFVHVGVAQVSPNPNSIELSVAGTPVPGASFDADTEFGLAAEVGIYVPNMPVAISATLTSSVLTQNNGTGPLAGQNLGADSFMLGAITAHWHFNRDGSIRPYLGGGAGYFHPTGATDGLVTDLSIDGTWGGVLQGGAEFDFTDRWGVFLDFKQYYIDVEATGLMGPAPVAATAAIDPLVVNFGVNHRF